MANDITIKTLRWDLQCSRIAVAKKWQDEVSAFSNERLPALIEHAFSTHNKNEIIQIDLIELNLANIDDENDLSEAFELALKKFIAEKIDFKDYKTEDEFTESLQFFLFYGYLPWNADKKLFSDTGAILEKIFSSQPQQLKNILTAVVNNDTAVIRFIELFQPFEIEKLLQWLLKREWQYITVLINKIFLNIILNWQNHPYRKIILYKELIRFAVLQQSFSDAIFLKQWLLNIQAQHFISEDVKKILADFISENRGKKAVDSISEDEKNKAVDFISENERKKAVDFISSVKKETDDYVTYKLSPIEIKLLKELADTIPGSKQLQNISDDIQIFKTEKNTETNQTFFIQNAGLILLYPYLKNYFLSKNLININTQFLNDENKMKAAKLLQFIICGHTNFKEYDLVLNKILCGFTIEEPIIIDDAAIEYENDEAENILRSTIKNWSKLGNISINGFRNSFLFRNGKLEDQQNNYILYVERKGWDLLMDALPYTFNVIKLPWMEKPLYVQW